MLTSLFVVFDVVKSVIARSVAAWQSICKAKYPIRKDVL